MVAALNNKDIRLNVITLDFADESLKMRMMRKDSLKSIKMRLNNKPKIKRYLFAYVISSK